MASLLLAVLALANLSCAPAGQPEPGSEWPQFLGPQRDGKSPDSLAQEWGSSGPPVLWRRPVGAGYAAVSIAGGRLLLFHRVDDEERVEALDPWTGATRWVTANPTDYRDNTFGFDEGPRAAPTIVDGVVYTCGVQKFVQALDLETGERFWGFDGRERFKTVKGPFGAACSPLVWQGRVMLNLGGRDNAGIVAIDAADAALLWSATDHGAGYAAPVITTIGEQTHVLFFTRAGLVDLDPIDGRVRAQLPWRSRSLASVNAASPVVIGERVFLSSTYQTGAVLLEIGAAGFETVWSDDRVLSNHYATSIHYQGTLFGYHGRQPSVPSLRAVDLESGEVLWRERDFGAGSLLMAGSTLVVLHENGELFLAPASRDGFEPRARARILEGVVRAYPALASGVLYARNETELVALDLRPPR